MFSSWSPLALVLLSFPFSVPTATLPQSSSSATYLSFITYRHAAANKPCVGINGTVSWPLDYVNPNTSGTCFDDGTDHLTCIRRYFLSAEGFAVDTVPRKCAVEGYQERGCSGSSRPASYNGAAEWTWDGSAMDVNIRSFRMACTPRGANFSGVGGSQSNVSGDGLVKR